MKYLRAKTQLLLIVRGGEREDDIRSRMLTIFSMSPGIESSHIVPLTCKH